MDDKFQEIFKKCLKIENKTVSVKTLLSERNLNRIKYDPYYQRNYVWDNVKQSFFIESVVLGTEIPPLIFFKSGLKIEVIDGRQRFETLKRFKENEFKLDGKGLMELSFLATKSFKNMDDVIREAFLSSNIRIFEYEIVNYPNLNNEIEDRVKKEIFRRYNTGITPLSAVEVDNAKYLDDGFSVELDSYLNEDHEFASVLAKCFLNSEVDGALPIQELKNLLRKLYVLNHFPISKFAGGKNRIETLDLLYDFTTQDLEDPKQQFMDFKRQLDTVLDMYSEWSNLSDKFNNRLIYEPILWAIRVLSNESLVLEIQKNELKLFVEKNLEAFGISESHYYGRIIKRFELIADYFQMKSGVDFSEYIRNKAFGGEIKERIKSRSAEENKIEEFQNLRFHKPAPISTPIEEIILDISNSKYLLRPPYQRKERISVLKASSIIESILLGINLPPLFIYKRKNGIKEVIDGQQRLLSIMGFMGKHYLNELGKVEYSKNDSYKLKGLKVLHNLNGSNYSKLIPINQEKILDFTIDLIIIEEQLNLNFEPTDLFIRLNNKPYPIKQNSFEMWNSTVDFEVIQLIKEVANKHINWFYIKETKSDPNLRRDRMENEEFITILSYLNYSNKSSNANKVIGFFKRNNEVTCRLNHKAGLTDFLQKLENEASEKNQFMESIRITDHLISAIKSYFVVTEDSTAKNKLNELLNVGGKPVYRRSLQDFYVLWLKLISSSDYLVNDLTLTKAIALLKKFRNIDNNVVDEVFIEGLVSELMIVDESN